MSTISTDDQALLDRFAGLDDQELSRSFLAAEEQLRAHRNGFGRTREKAHGRVDEAFEAARRDLDGALARVRYVAATSPVVQAGELAEAARVFGLVSLPGFAETVHGKIDSEPLRGEVDPFVSIDEAGWRARRAELEGEVRAIERARVLRGVVRAQDAADRRLAALEAAA